MTRTEKALVQARACATLLVPEVEWAEEQFEVLAASGSLIMIGSEDLQSYLRANDSDSLAAITAVTRAASWTAPASCNISLGWGRLNGVDQVVFVLTYHPI